MTKTIHQARYLVRITDAPGQPSRVYESSDDLHAAIGEARRMAAAGYVGGSVAVVDSTIDHPDRNIVHVERRRT